VGLARSGRNLISAQPELVITRTLDAPPEKVFEAWTQPLEMLRWGGPKDHPMVDTEGDVKPGGEWKSTLRGPGGDELKQSGVWKEVEKPRHLAYTFGWDQSPMGTPRRETMINIDLEPAGDGKTRMIFKQGPFDTAANRDGHREGWNSSFDRLEEYLLQ
jgi:uncharacterized protein YndB with AHSA1/START domain